MSCSRDISSASQCSVGDRGFQIAGCISTSVPVILSVCRSFYEYAGHSKSMNDPAPQTSDATFKSLTVGIIAHAQ